MRIWRAMHIALLLIGGLACSRAPAPAPAAPAPAPAAPAIAAGDPVEGERVATRVGCNGCHGPGGRGQVLRERPAVGRGGAPNRS